jgi:hypothetical protein
MSPPHFVNRLGLKMPTKLGVHVPGKQKAIADAVDHPLAANLGGELTKPAPEASFANEAARVISKIPLIDLVVEDGRSVDTNNVKILTDSFREAGQTSAILVVRKENGGFHIISGNDRVLAAKALEWDEIEAAVLNCDERSQGLIEIADEYHRREHSVLERADKQAKWIHLLRLEGVQGAQPTGGRQPADQGLSKAARALGVTKEETMRSFRISGISPEAKLVARELGFHDNQAVLLQIAKLTTPGDQIALLREISERKKAPRKGGVTRKQAEAAAVSASTTEAETPERLQEDEPVGAGHQREDTPSASPEPYPDLLRGIDRRPVDAELEKLTDEWRSSRLRKMLGCSPLDARDRFIWEVFFAEFPDAFVKALPRTADDGQS